MYYTVIKHDGRLRTRGKCRKHAAQASVFYISRVFSNVRSFLSQCNIVLTCVTVLTSKIPHKVENKLPPNSKIQETDPLTSLRSGTRRFTIICANRRKVYAPFGCQISLWTNIFYILETAEITQHSSSNSNRGQFLATLRGFETHKVCYSNNQNTPQPLLSNFFTTQILGGSVTRCN